MTSDERTRREFVQQLGLGVAAAWSAGGLSYGSGMVQGSCAPPSHGSATPWVRDCRPIRPRQPANRLNTAEVAQLKAAYKAMRDLDTSDPNDPRGFRQQANVHCFHCATSDPSLQVHSSWKFFAWHRAYLYFHERILGALIGDPNFRLPFWGWDTAGFQAIPVPFVTPNDASNPLFNGTRVLAPGVVLPAEDVGSSVISDALNLPTFAEFGGTASGSGSPEGSPHGSVHVDVGGDMGAFASAARDPLFYQHHATVDKMWSDWNKASSTHLNPSDAAFRDITFTFFDEKKVWRSIKVSQVLDHEHSLRYVYEPYRFWDVFRCVAWRPIQIDWRNPQRLAIPRQNPTLMNALQGDTPLRFQLGGVVLPTNKSTVYRVYSTLEYARADQGPGSPGYLGSIGAVLTSRETPHQMRGSRNVVLSLGPSVRRALAQGSELALYLVDRNDRASQVQPIPLRAASISLSRGTMEEER